MGRLDRARSMPPSAMRPGCRRCGPCLLLLAGLVHASASCLDSSARHAPADPRLERDLRRRSRRSSCSTTRRCATGCSRRRCSTRRSRRSCASCTSSTRSGSTRPTSACPAPGRTSCGTSSGWRARSSMQRLRVRGQLRGADARRRHQADRRDLAARRHRRSSAGTFIGSSPIRQYAEGLDASTSCSS